MIINSKKKETKKYMSHKIITFNCDFSKYVNFKIRIGCNIQEE